MYRKNVPSLLALSWIFLVLFAAPVHLDAQQSAPAPLGLFENHADVGAVLHPGSAVYDASKRVYTVTASGENMWSTADGFHFVWKRVSGDVALTADISFLGKGVNAHRKAVLMIRQSLDADSAYADVALHGDGLTSLQYREEKGAVTHEIQSNVSASKRLRIEKRGDYFIMSLSGSSYALHLAGGSLRLPLEGPFYLGIGVSSHDNQVVEKAEFANVHLVALPPVPAAPSALYSILETITLESMNRRVVYIAPEKFEAPNWTRDGASLLFNRSGHIQSIPLNNDTPAPAAPVTIPTGFAIQCNNDHGISPDGSLLAISDNSQDDRESTVYIVPFAGGKPRRITHKSPSYWHGWSPDGKTLAFVGQRNGDFDVYTIPAAGGEETRLTTAKGLDDGPDYSPDGKYIYFNSERTGSMQIWRMRADGSEQEQLTSDGFNNWFPHVSPDGRQMVFLTYEKTVTGHPENKDVMLRVMTLSDKKVSVLTKLFGGQGTINVPSWSPDSSQLAFVSYQLMPQPETRNK